MTLEETLAQIKPLDKNAMDVAAKRWDSIAKPLHSLGKMEKLVIQIAGITGNPDMKIQKRALVPMCADNGVVEEGVTQTGQERDCRSLLKISFPDDTFGMCYEPPVWNEGYSGGYRNGC